jgi:hypothetical protein
VSDAFEHPYDHFGNLRGIADKIVGNVAAHVRRALFELGDVPKSCCDVLMGAPYDRPKGPPKLAHYFFGRIIGEGPELAADGNAYPILNWKYRLRPVINPETDTVQYTGPVTITPRLGKGLSLTIHRMGMWDGSSFVEPAERAEMLARAPLINDISLEPTGPRTHEPFLLDSAHDAEMISLLDRFIVNCNSMSWVLRSILRHFGGADGLRRSRSTSLRVLAKALARTVADQVSGGEMPADLLLGVEKLEATRRTVTEGMLLSNIVEQHGPPEFTVLAKSQRGKRICLDLESLKTAVDTST